MPDLGIVTCVSEEAELLASVTGEVVVRCSGMGRDRARFATRELLKMGCKGLVSFGIAAGLDPSLRPGTVVLADVVVDERGGEWQPDPVWRDLLYHTVRKNVPIISGRIVSSDRMVTTPLAKRQLELAHDAVAVDMGSCALAAAAVEHGVPFIVVKAISDPAWTTIPRTILKGVAPDGSRLFWETLRRLLSRPRDIPEVIRYRNDTGKAIRALGRVTAWTEGSFSFH